MCETCTKEYHCQACGKEIDFIDAQFGNLCYDCEDIQEQYALRNIDEDTSNK